MLMPDILILNGTAIHLMQGLSVLRLQGHPVVIFYALWSVACARKRRTSSSPSHSSAFLASTHTHPHSILESQHATQSILTRVRSPSVGGAHAYKHPAARIRATRHASLSRHRCGVFSSRWLTVIKEAQQELAPPPPGPLSHQGYPSSTLQNCTNSTGYIIRRIGMKDSQYALHHRRQIRVPLYPCQDF